jgi:hypothetical protein
MNIFEDALVSKFAKQIREREDAIFLAYVEGYRLVHGLYYCAEDKKYYTSDIFKKEDKYYIMNKKNDLIYKKNLFNKIKIICKLEKI